MGKNKGGGKPVNRAREKTNHRQGKGRGGSDDEGDVPQELKDRAAILGCEVWELDKAEAKAAMREANSDSEEDSSDDEETKKPIKASKAKANMAAANRDMPPSSSDEDEGVEVIKEEVNEEEKKEEENDDSSDDDAELERLYGMGRNNNASVAVAPQAKQGYEPKEEAEDGSDESDDDEEDDDAPKQSLDDFLN